MNCRMKHVLLAALLCFYTTAFAKPGNITGKITDQENHPLAAVNVVVLMPDNKTLVKSDLTNDKGQFNVENIPDGTYTVKVNLLGYEIFTAEKVVIANGNIDLPVISLKAKENTLKEVAVRAQKPFIEIQADKIVVNVENSIVSAGSSALDILSRSPGVKVDQNDNISLKGKQGVNVLMDGKLTPMSGTDLANMLKSMPSSSIDKIELISNPGARYDAAGTAGIINIRTKKDQRLGMNGSVNASYAQGVYPKYGAGFNLNYRNKKFNVYANYNYAYRLWFNHLMLNRRFLDTSKADYGKKLFTYDQDNYALFDFKNHIASAGADYNVSKNTTIGFSGSMATNSFNPKTDNASKALGANDELLYYFNTAGRHVNKYYNYAANLNLRHTFDTTGRELTVDADYAAFGNQSNQSFKTVYTAPDSSNYLPDYSLKSDLTGITQVRSLKADYSNPLKNNAKFEAGIKSSYVTADNEPLFYEQVGGVYVLDAKRSNHFVYNENINAAYLNGSKDWKKWSTQLGLRMENTNAAWEQITLNQKYDTSYVQLFPNIAVQRHLDTKNDIGITLSRRIERPNYQQLNPFKYFIDKTTYREGYPYLSPAFSYNIELSHTFKQRFITTLTYATTSNIIIEVIQPSDNEDSVTVQTNKNLKRMTFYGINGSYPFQITKWWSNVTNFNIYYSRYEGNIANTNINAGKPTFDLNTNNTFLLPKDFSCELGFWYQARQQYGFMDVKPNWMLNAGIQKNLFDKRATIKANIQDIFWKGYPRATSTYTGYQEDFVAVRDTRQASISFTYRFGKRTVAPMRRRSGGAEEEKRRANSGGA